jgi:2-amino-4-hydroxy-6-hydroxymethyldihydropteridine diphosphokinase
MNTVYLLLGSNQGDRKDLFEKAKKAITLHFGHIVNQSALYESEAWGITDQALFLNCVLEVKSNLDAETILQKSLLIEQELGRVRHQRWAERTIDIDLLYFNHDIIVSDTLTIPHPEIQNRRFTLIPLCEIAKNLVHPIFNKSQEELLNECGDTLKVWTV